MTAPTWLDEIDRLHDAQPAVAAEQLRARDPAALPAADLSRYAFLVNHVLGEKHGAWAEAAGRLAPLAARADAPLPLLRQHAVAAHLAGSDQADAAVRRLARSAEAAPEAAALLVRVAALAFASPHVAAPLAALAAQAAALPAGPLDAAFAASLNNATNALYYATREAPLAAELRSALRRGAEAALMFWRRAGGWTEHERALYLRAKIALRTREPVAAVMHAEQALAIIAAAGDDATEKAFVLALLAAGVEHCGQAGRAAQLRAQLATLAATLDADTRALLAQDAAEFPPLPPRARVAFIGGGNLATALVGGLARDGALASLHVVEVDAERRAQWAREHGAITAAAPDAALAGVDVIVLAVKPQQMREVCAVLAPHVGDALLLSVAAGIRATDIARWCGTRRVVRSMPNTPALIGQGISGVAALPEVTPAERALATRILAAAGEVVWFDDEAQLDPVTAISGSGPAYVFHFIEALQRAGCEFGFSEAQARQLAIATFSGAVQLAAQSEEPLAVLRERVTSKGGTTAAALAVMAADDVAGRIVAATRAANARAREMGDAFGRS